MLIVLKVTPPLLAPGFTHDATNWYIYEADTDNLVWKKENDTVNKLTKLIFADLDPEKEYYAKAAYVFNKYVSEPSDAVIITHTKPADIVENFDIPSVVSTPTVTVNADPLEVPNAFFQINTTPFATTSNAKHVSTTYAIYDMDGKPTWFIAEDTDNLTSIQLKDTVLVPGKMYIVAAAHKSSSNDVSNLGKLPIFVPKVEDLTFTNLDITGYSKSIAVGADLSIELAPIDNLDSIITDIYDVTTGTITRVGTVTTSGTIVVIPGSYFTATYQKLILKFKVKYTDGTYSDPQYVEVNVT